jgi:hypothetical protein
VRRRYRFQYSVLEYIHKFKGLTLLYLTEFLWGVRIVSALTRGKIGEIPFSNYVRGNGVELRQPRSVHREIRLAEKSHLEMG